MGRSARWHYKRIEFFEDNHVELYNLRDGICEEHDLADQLPDLTAPLQAILHNWQQSFQAVIPQPNPRYVAWS